MTTPSGVTREPCGCRQHPHFDVVFPCSLHAEVQALTPFIVNEQTPEQLEQENMRIEADAWLKWADASR